MAFVNKVNIKKNYIRNCEEFASCFIDIIDKETAEYYVVRIIFFRYQKDSLKGNTRETRTKGYSAVHYKALMQQKLVPSKQKIFCLRSKPKKN